MTFIEDNIFPIERICKEPDYLVYIRTIELNVSTQTIISNKLDTRMCHLSICVKQWVKYLYFNATKG